MPTELAVANSKHGCLSCQLLADIGPSLPQEVKLYKNAREREK